MLIVGAISGRQRAISFTLTADNSFSLVSPLASQGKEARGRRYAAI
jgi:hypothetical protein